MTKEQLKVHIRVLVPSDMPLVQAIEDECHPFPWLTEDFKAAQQQRNCIGAVCEYQDNRVVGFMLYELEKSRIHVLKLVVAQNFRRHGIGQQMIDSLVDKIKTSTRRTRIVLEVRETNLGAQLFLRQCGFKASSILRNHYKDTPEDGYRMCNQIKKP